MKRSMCLLLVLALLLPAFAVAEDSAVRVQISMSADKAGVQAYLENGGVQTEKMKELAAAMAALMNTVSLDITADDMRYGLQLNLRDTPVLDMSLDLESELIRFSLLDDVAVSYADEHADADVFEELLALDWQAIMDGLEETVASFVQRTADAAGAENFDGDVYEGADYYAVVCFTDADIAAWINEMMDVIAPARMLLEKVDDWALLFAELDEINRRASTVDQYTYELEFAYHGDDVIGTDLSVLEGETPVMLLSGGYPYEGDPRHKQGELEFLLTLPLDYTLAEHHVLLWADEKDGEQALHIRSNVYHTMQWFSVEEMEAGNGLLAQQFTLDISLRGMDDGTAMLHAEDRLYDAEQGVIGSTTDAAITADGLVNGETQVYAGEEKQAAWSLLIRSEAAEPLKLGTETERIIAISDLEDEQLLNELVEKSATDLTIKLLQLLPPEVLVLLF